MMFQVEMQVKAKISRLEQHGLLRSLSPRPPLAIDLTKNDYLGISKSTTIQALLHDSVKDLPMGAIASRAVDSSQHIQDLENAIANFAGGETGLYFPSAYAANESLISALALKKVKLLSDELNHASIVDGIRHCPLPASQKFRFKHNCIESLETLLQQRPEYTPIVITEAVFSMNGDRAPLKAFAKRVHHYGGILVVDEAHSFGVLGPEGRGLAHPSLLGESSACILRTLACGKALAAQGGVVIGPGWLREYLYNTSRKFIYTTGPSPWIVGGLTTLMTELPRLETRRARLKQIAQALNNGLTKMGFDTLDSQSHIIPILTESESKTMQCAHFLEEQGILIAPIRPPTVAKGRSRLRLSAHAALSDTDLSFILESFQKMRDFIR